MPRIKFYTRSFDLRLYRLSSGLFRGLKDDEGRTIPCVRLTDKSADGYLYAMLRDRDCDIAMAQFIAEDIHPGGVFQHEIRFAAACGDFQDALFPAQIPVDPCGDIIRFHPASSV